MAKIALSPHRIVKAQLMKQEHPDGPRINFPLVIIGQTRRRQPPSELGAAASVLGADQA
jgi:hypothetical protein